MISLYYYIIYNNVEQLSCKNTVIIFGYIPITNTGNNNLSNMVENALPFKSDTLVPYLSPPTEVFILILSDNSDLYTAAEEFST